MAHIGFLPVYAKGHMYPASTLALAPSAARPSDYVFLCCGRCRLLPGIRFGLVSWSVASRFRTGYVDQVFAALGKLKGQAGVLYTLKRFEDQIDMHSAELPQAIQSQAGRRFGH